MQNKMEKNIKITKNNARLLVVSIFLCLVISLFAISLVSAETRVTYNIKYGIIEDNGDLTKTNDDVNDFYVAGYACLADGCAQVGSNTISGLTGHANGHTGTVTFPTTMVTDYGYVLYFYKQGHIGYERPNIKVADTHDQIIDSRPIYLSQKRNGFAPISNLRARNKINPGEPITVNIDVAIDAETASALQRDTVSDVPLDENVETEVRVEVFNSNGITVYSESKSLNIEYDDMVDVGFVTDDINTPGVYKIRVSTEVTDDKIINSIPRKQEINITVGEQITLPVIDIISPEDGETYDTTQLALEVSADQTIDTWTYVLNGVGPITFTPGDLINAREGENTLIVYGTNTNGVGTDSIVFDVDSSGEVTPLEISVLSPVNGMTYNTTEVPLQVTSNQEAEWIYSLNIGTPTSFDPDNFLILPAVEGRNVLFVQATNVNGTEWRNIVFYVNTSSGVEEPSVTIRNPVGGSVHTSFDLTLEATSDQEIDTWEYILNNDSRNDFVPGVTVITALEGLNTLTVIGTNVNGTGYDMSIFYVNSSVIEDLDISIVSPVNGMTYNVTDLDLEVLANKEVDTWTYVLNGIDFGGFVPNITITAQEGVNTLVVTGVAGTETDAETVVFYVDTSSGNDAPVITVYNPEENRDYDDPEIGLNVGADQTIDTWTYVLNNNTPVVFTPNTTIDAREGENTLVVFGTNVNGTGSYTVVFYIDTDDDDDDDDDNGNGGGGLIILKPSDVLVNPGRVGNETGNVILTRKIKNDFPWMKCLIYILVFLIVIALILIALALARD